MTQPHYIRRSFRVPMNDEQALKCLAVLKTSEKPFHVSPDPDRLGYMKVKITGKRKNPNIPKPLMKYAHDYDSWHPVDKPGYLEGIEYKILQKGEKTRSAKIVYRGTVPIYPGYGFRKDVEVKGDAVFHDGMPDEDELHAAIREDIEMTLREREPFDDRPERQSKNPDAIVEA